MYGEKTRKILKTITEVEDCRLAKRISPYQLRGSEAARRDGVGTSMDARKSPGSELFSVIHSKTRLLKASGWVKTTLNKDIKGALRDILNR